MRIDSLAEDRICARAGVGIPSTGTGSRLLKASERQRSRLICSKDHLLHTDCNRWYRFSKWAREYRYLRATDSRSLFHFVVVRRTAYRQKGIFRNSCGVVVLRFRHACIVYGRRHNRAQLLNLRDWRDCQVIAVLLDIPGYLPSFNECGLFLFRLSTVFLKVSAIYVPILYLVHPYWA